MPDDGLSVTVNACVVFCFSLDCSQLLLWSACMNSPCFFLSGFGPCVNSMARFGSSWSSVSFSRSLSATYSSYAIKSKLLDQRVTHMANLQQSLL